MRKRRTGHSWIERMKLCVRTMVLEPKTWDECCSLSSLMRERLHRVGVVRDARGLSMYFWLVKVTDDTKGGLKCSHDGANMT